MKYKNLLSIVFCVLWLSACSNLPTATSRALAPTLPPASQPTLPMANTPSPRTIETAVANDELDLLRLTWRHDFETMVGFSHPIFETISDNLPRDSVYFRNYDIMPSFIQTTVEDITYTGMIVDCSVGTPFRSFLLFSVENGVAELIYSIGWEYVSFNQFENHGAIISGFADRNGNDYLDIAVNVDSAGSAGFGYLSLLEIYPNGEVLDITPRPDELTARYFADIDDDGILEIEAYYRYHVDPNVLCEAQPVMRRYFGWDGTAYQDISSRHPELYYPAIVEYQKGLLRWYAGCTMPNAGMYQAMINYYILGRLREGWAWLEPRLRLDACRLNGVPSYRIDNLLKWVYARLAGEHQ